MSHVSGGDNDVLNLPKGSVRLFVCLILLVPDRRLVSQ